MELCIVVHRRKQHRGHMGLCTTKSTVALTPDARVITIESGEQVADSGMQMWDDRTSTTQAGKNRTASGVWSGDTNPFAKGYLELGGKGEGEPQTSRETEEEDDTDGDDVVELLNVSGSEGSLRSQFLD